MSSTPEATDLLETIMMSMKWQDVQTARRSKIGSPMEKDVSFLVPTLRECGKSK